ncbi:competence protein ComEA [Klenkia soli]|uniref:Competence protein ComEA n=1 Tax=Klenkia soli TaxID=1052260 RepID=A0A1H0KQL1_9ACTN|nr:ComEA family DNA-binding protein [Klenkia soli]SDO58264.1 competence protein ComEA [Klenkia soli]
MPAVLFSSRRADDADVIRARLRALLDDGAAARGWLPDDDPVPGPGTTPAAGDAWADDEDPDSWSTDDAPAEPDRATARTGSGRHRASGPSARIDPGPHGARTLWVVAVLAAVAVAGWSWIGRPDVEPVSGDGVATAVPAASTGSPTSAPAAAVPSASSDLVVAVVGQVVSPGLVTLPAGSRVADAVAAAGGLLPEADPAALNGAALLVDGQQVAVGVPGAAGGAGGGTDAGTTSGLVDLNTATVADLDALPGIGPVLAQRIVDHRAQHGPFGTVEQLDDVSGIGPSLYAEISPLVTV